MPAAHATPSRPSAHAQPHSIDIPGDAAPKVEAILLSIDRPVPAARIAEAIFHPSAILRQPHADSEDSPPDLPEPRANAAESRAVEDLIASLNRQYERTGRAFRIELVAGGYRIMTLAMYSEVIARFRHAKAQARLTRAAVESLAIIAYRQPVTRAELEAIRGVACGDVLKSLMERRLITITGRAEELGRPMLYGTTRQFLDHFGFASIKDLPSPEEFKAGA